MENIKNMETIGIKGGVMEKIYYESENTDVSSKCKLCGMGDINCLHSICTYCGWEDDGLQNEEQDYMGGANKMSFNQYKKFWEENRDEILKSNNTCFKAIDLAKKYYQKNFEKS